MSASPRTSSAPPTRLSVALPPEWRQHTAHVVSIGTVVHVLLVLSLLVLLCGISENWWFSAALSYLPRAPYLVFSLLVIPALVLHRWAAAAVNVLCGLLIAGPIMGLCAPTQATAAGPVPSESLLVVSCNVQNGDADLSKVLSEFDALQPDVVALQEVDRGGELLAEHFVEWNTIHVDEYWISSRFPIRLIAECAPEVSGRTTALMFEIDAPVGAVRLSNVHLNTARHGLNGLRWHSVLSGAGVDDLRWHQWERRLEAEETVKFVNDHAGPPMLVVGDFNTPTSSSLFQDVWSGWQSAFDTAGWGYGFTSPCNTGRLWPSNTPWLRIDHVLCDRNWQIQAAGIGHTDGSDHRLVWSRVSLRHGEPNVPDVMTARRD